MARITKYTCDKCGHEQPTGEQMWMVAVTYTHVSGGQIGSAAVHKEEMRCRNCTENLGIPPVSVRRQAPPPPTTSTFEGIIHELIPR